MLIAGAGGFARETLEVLLQLKYKKKIYFFDDINLGNTNVLGYYRVIKNYEEAKKIFRKHNKFCIGVGGCKQREELYKKLSALHAKPYTLVSPFAYIGKNKIEIGEGCSIMTGAIITTNIIIGEGSLVNLNCTIGHDSVIGKFCELSPGVHISGNCKIGDYCSIGTGAVILPNIIIEDNAVIGAGAVITKNVSSYQTIVGIPGRSLNN